METLGERLRVALIHNQKMASDLARDLNIPKSAISQYMSGKSKNMDSDRLYAIAKYLHVNPAWLMGYEVSMFPMQEGQAHVLRLYNAMTMEQRRQAISYMEFLVNQEGKL